MFSCSTTRLPEKQEYLYKGTELHIESNKKNIPLPAKKELKQVVSPQPNSKIAGVIPFKRWMYSLAGDSVSSKGFRYWLKNKIGEPPVLFREYYIETSVTQLANALENRGYYHYNIATEKKIRNQKIKMAYNIEVDVPYCIDSVSYPEITDSLSRYISKYRNESMLEPGDQFNISILEKERERIDKALKNDGFYYFSPDFLYFRIDSATDKRTMNMELTLKDNLPADARKIFYLNNIYLHHNYTVNEQDIKMDTLYTGGMYHLYKNEMNVKTSIFTRSVFMEKGQQYNRENYTRTLEKLINLGIYKYVNIRFEKKQGNDSLNVHIHLTQARPKSIRAEFQAVSKSNDFVGPALNISYRDHNLTRGAQLFRYEVNAGYETQIAGDNRGLDSYEIGTEAGLNIPRIIFPFVNLNQYINRRFSPETRIKLSYSFIDRRALYHVNTFNFAYGYRWRETRTKTHDFDLLSIDYTETDNIDPSVRNNYFFNQNFQEQFIFSLKYDFTMNDLFYKDRFLNTYFNISADLAGNTLSLFRHIISGDEPDAEDPSKIFGIAYSQYARFLADFRMYFNISDNQKLVSRVTGGLGLPYGNSRFMPYKKQFFAGGATSLRGFSWRTVGPGTYNPPDSLGQDAILEQSGDIKIETNLEYRFGIYKFLKGALFADAGNVWLINKVDEIPGGTFDASTFVNDLAVSAGFGIRIDPTFVVIRLDLGFPLRKPQEKGVIGNINFANSNWRKENLIFNLAIGYPF
jgi:outer membrane protein assembly factor BamA